MGQQTFSYHAKYEKKNKIVAMNYLKKKSSNSSTVWMNQRITWIKQWKYPMEKLLKVLWNALLKNEECYKLIAALFIIN